MNVGVGWKSLDYQQAKVMQYFRMFMSNNRQPLCKKEPQIAPLNPSILINIKK
jgi:hypothetical protein